MTRENIEGMREVILPFVKKKLLEINYENLGKSDAEEFTRDFNEILDLAIKALEQELILDKIRAEIAEYGSIWVEYAITKDTKTDKGIEKLVSSVLKQAKEQVLQIIDKYKAESEDK